MIFDAGAMPVPVAVPLGEATVHGLGQYLDPAAIPATWVPWSQTAIPQGAAAFGPVTPFGQNVAKHASSVTRLPDGEPKYSWLRATPESTMATYCPAPFRDRMCASVASTNPLLCCR